MLSDLWDSGEWEQSADVVAMLYRDEIYNPDSPDKGCAELLIRKHRGGVLGIIRYDSGQYSCFESMAGGLPSWDLPHRQKETIEELIFSHDLRIPELQTTTTRQAIQARRPSAFHAAASRVFATVQASALRR